MDKAIYYTKMITILL